VRRRSTGLFWVLLFAAEPAETGIIAPHNWIDEQLSPKRDSARTGNTTVVDWTKVQ